MSELEAMQRKIEALDHEVATRARRLRILGYTLLGAALILLAWGVWMITTQPQPAHTVDYVDVVTATPQLTTHNAR